ncbi:hypothetical protein BFP97_13230 [Roseivirga sp. 4D4]|uniref:tetratricopeptide repeat protein n=1 Tax=Roseivirga sp. 4D4 TaxID=1889784 RepID=UPI000852E600|nr:hypothetical protein [Roseivirga sp. 4D4]OEK02425.1 hypothetical protein BFP97_13230 [Roseivirga sp. 4D4]
MPLSKVVDIALLERYLADEIPAKEVCYSDGSPLSTDELKKAVDNYNDTIVQLEGAALKAQLQDSHEHLVTQVKQVPSSRRWLAIAASVVLIGVFGTLIWQRINKPPVFSDYFDHFDQLLTYRDSDSTNYSDGLEAYSLRNYQKAYTLLENIEGLTDEVKFYLAISALAIEKPKEAILIFETIGTDKSNKFYQQTQWYLGLAHWQNGDIDSALNALKGISPGQFKYEEAIELQEKLFR